MDPQQKHHNTGSKSGFLQGIDPKVKLLVVIMVIAAGVLVFLKSSLSEKYAGISVDGMTSEASYWARGTGTKELAPVAETKPAPDFGGGPEDSCLNGACLDPRIQVTRPAAGARIGPRKTHKITWTEDESIESRFHEISIHPIDCNVNCPNPYVIATKYRGQGTYNWWIGSFIIVPQNLQNIPVWLRVTTQGRYDENGMAANYYNQTPVVVSRYR